MIDFNLICTTSRNLEQEAIIEINSILTKLGDSAKIQKAEPSGIIIVKTNKEPELVIQELKDILKDDPWKIRYLKRVIPIEFTSSNTNQLLTKIESIKTKIKENETFRITIKKRFSTISTKELIEDIAKLIDRQVNLDKPKWVVQVEIINGIIGVSIIRPENILNVMKEKRGF